MLTRIKFITNGCHTTLGNFGPGDVANVPADLADHLINQVRCAKLADQPAAAAPREKLVLKRPSARKQK